MTTKITDSKGRVALGKSFANKTVFVRKISETKVVIETARVIPDSETWLWDNEAAIQSVQRGLKDAHDEKFVTGPDVDSDLELFGDDEE
jgi:hypothetical protein